MSSKLKSERRHLRPLPPAPVPEYVNYRARVRRWSTIRVSNRTYSVPSRLIGVVVDVRLYADHIKVYYKGHLVESMERLHGAGEAQIDYRHIIGSLVRKARGVRPVPLQGVDVPGSHVQAGVRRAVWMEGRACRRGVCSYPPPGRDNHGVEGGQGDRETACGVHEASPPNVAEGGRPLPPVLTIAQAIQVEVVNRIAIMVQCPRDEVHRIRTAPCEGMAGTLVVLSRPLWRTDSVSFVAKGNHIQPRGGSI